MTEIPFGKWMPDAPALTGEGSSVALNVRPKENSYGPLPSLAPVTDALIGECRGAIAAKDSAGNVSSYAGDPTKLYRLVSGVWTDSSKVGDYTIFEQDRWGFLSWNDQVFATQISDPLQFIDKTTGTQFADLITSTLTPAAKHIARVRAFLVLGFTEDAVNGRRNNRVAWSGANDPTDFDPSPTTLAGGQNLDSAGDVQRVVGGSHGTIFQEGAITRMTFAGSPLKFQFDTVEENRGAFAPGGVVKFGANIFYIAQDGFFVFTGAGSEPIGAGVLNDFFFKDLNNSLKDSITSAIDLENSLVVWAYPSNSSSNIVDKLLFYNWVGRRWAEAEVDTQALLSTLSEGFTLEELDQFGTIDTLPASLDSRIWAGGVVDFGAFNADNRLGTFSGPALAATLETEERALAGVAMKALLQGVRPIVDGAPAASLSVAVCGRNDLGDMAVLGPDTPLNAVGEARFRNRARYHRIQVKTSSDFEHAQGVDARGKAAGW